MQEQYTNSYQTSSTVGTTSESDDPINPSFIQKMGYFRKMGSMSLTPPMNHTPVWRSRADSIHLDWRWQEAEPFWRSQRFRFLAVIILASLSFIFAIWTYVADVSLSIDVPGSILHSSIPHAVTCDPFSSPGTLMVSQVNADATRWIPFDTSCSPPSFFTRLRQGDTSDMDWIYNKTILTIGDVIDREHVEQFCALMGKDAEIVRDVRDWKAPTKADKGRRFRTKLTGRDVREATMPRVCYLPEYDFLLASVFHYGLDEVDFFQKTPSYTAPGLFEARLADQVVPFVHSLAARGQSGAPDLIEVSSGSYDLLRWAKEDVEAGSDAIGPLDSERVFWYRNRVMKMLDSVHKQFPASPKLWRSIHFPIDQAAELQYYEEKIGISKKAREAPAHFSTNRVTQLDHAIRSILLPNTATASLSRPAPKVAANEYSENYRFNPWGSLMLGHSAHQTDRLHGNPGAPGTALYGDIILYELFRSTLRLD